MAILLQTWQLANPMQAMITPTVALAARLALVGGAAKSTRSHGENTTTTPLLSKPRASSIDLVRCGACLDRSVRDRGHVLAGHPGRARRRRRLQYFES